MVLKNLQIFSKVLDQNMFSSSNVWMGIDKQKCWAGDVPLPKLFFNKTLILSLSICILFYFTILSRDYKFK